MKSKKTYLTIIFTLILLFIIQQNVIASDIVVINFYYSEACPSCEEFLPIIDQVEKDKNYTDKIAIFLKDVGSNETNRQEWRNYGFYSYPSIVVYLENDNTTNITKIPKDFLNYQNLTNAIDTYLKGLEIKNNTYEEGILRLNIPFIGQININLSGLSLPILTIVLGAVDSFNPCSIFILFILLSLLIHSHSKKRMILVGSIFIFFSGLWYFIFMFVLLRTFGALEAEILSIIVGTIAIIFGIVNIKDFFYPKKGVSFSIPKDKKPGIFKQMRDIVKTPSVLTAIAGTIFLAITVNLFELLCSLQWPLYYIARLSQYNYSETQNYMYMIFYNIVYVIPLIIIVILFVFSINKMKISEWQGQKLKLFSGIMIFTFGILFIINYKILGDTMIPIILLITSILLTTIISKIYKIIKPEKTKEEEK